MIGGDEKCTYMYNDAFLALCEVIASQITGKLTVNQQFAKGKIKQCI